MINLSKIKNFIVKHWKAFVAGALVLFGYILGTTGNREKVLQKDVKNLQGAQREVYLGTDKAIEKYLLEKEKNLSEKKSQEIEADKKENERKEELLKDSSKLDKILKDKYGLKGE